MARKRNAPQITGSWPPLRVEPDARTAEPTWVIAKGGINSHDTAVRGLEIHRAEVIGQMLPGLVSVLRPVEAAPEMVSCRHGTSGGDGVGLPPASRR